MIDRETVTIVLKILHNQAPEYVNELFRRLSDTHSRDLRYFKKHIFTLSGVARDMTGGGINEKFLTAPCTFR